MKIFTAILYFLASLFIPIIIIIGIFIVGAISISPKTGDPSEYLILMALVVWGSASYLGMLYFKKKEIEPIEALGILAGFLFWSIISILVLFQWLTI